MIGDRCSFTPVNRIGVSLGGEGRRSYPVFVGAGILPTLPTLLSEHCPAYRYAVIADAHVAELHGAALMGSLDAGGLDALLLPFPPGEWNKNREQWAGLTDRMLAAGIGRDGAVIAFGGGVAGDLAGFVAATYMRGIPLAMVPTTLLSMVDSSVGGKTGLDAPAGKNLVGAFHAPHLVVADIGLLATLPKSQLTAGMAEVIKHGVVADAGYFASLENGGPLAANDDARLLPLVTRSIEIKAAIVGEDEREHGRRAVLNFGHTIGHAIESLSGYELLHGEAVAIGMAAEARLAGALGFEPRRVIELLMKMNLPVECPSSLDANRVIEAMRADKKVRGTTIRFALPRDIGVMRRADDGAWTVPVQEPLIRQVLDSIT